MTECPNCVTPWKCNGPHMTDDLPLPTEEIAAYWDIAYAEGDRNARYDTSDGSAQSALQDLQEAIRAYGDARAAAAVAQERERWLPVLRSSVDAMDALTRHFTKTPSTLLDSTVRGKAHTTIAEARAAMRAGS